MLREFRQLELAHKRRSPREAMKVRLITRSDTRETRLWLTRGYQVARGFHRTAICGDLENRSFGKWNGWKKRRRVPTQSKIGNFERTCASRGCSRPQEVQQDACTGDLIILSVCLVPRANARPNEVKLGLFALRFGKFQRSRTL